MRLMRVLVAFAIVACLATGSDAFDSPKKGKGTGSKDKKKVDPQVAKQDSALVHELQGALHALDHAAVSFGGHRGKAMKEVKSTIAALEKEMKTRKQKAHGQAPDQAF